MTRKAPRTEPASDSKHTEYDRFEDLTRKLVRVPKQEIDSERAKQNGKNGNR